MVSMISPNLGCCDFQLATLNGSIICGRSMEYPVPIDSKVCVHVRGEERTSKAPDGTDGISWTAKYGYVCMNALDYNEACEGMNEKGLTFGVLSLECSQYPTVPPGEESKALSQIDVGCWILGNFATCDEVKEGLKDVIIWGQLIPILLKIPGLHFAIHDAQGNNLVIEFIDGQAVATDNPVGVLTNDPPIDWHLTNLQQYAGLTAEPSPDYTVNGVTVKSAGLGTGLVGLPGDYSSVSRFVRVATLVRLILPVETAIEGVNAALHILNVVDCPKGPTIAKIDDSTLYESTLWVTVKDVSNRILYWRSRNDLQLRAVDLKKLDFSPGKKYGQLIVQGTQQTYIDETGKLLSGGDVIEKKVVKKEGKGVCILS